MTTTDLMWIGAGLTLLIFLVAMVCEAILFFDPEVEPRFGLRPYIIFAEDPLPANRVAVRRTGRVAGAVALLLGITLLSLDILWR